MSAMTNATSGKRVGADALAEKGWFATWKWLILRRVSQFAILALFLLGPLYGVWIVKGNLAYSYTLGVLPLTDPYVALQSLLTGHVPEKLGCSVLRSSCSSIFWSAARLLFLGLPGQRRHRYGRLVAPPSWHQGSAHLSRETRYWVLAMTLVGSAVTGVVLWELINPVSMLHRGPDLRHGTRVGHRARHFPVRPVRDESRLVRAALSGRRLLWPDRALESGARFCPGRSACNDCMDCFEVCPEPRVIRPALKGAATGTGPVILSSACTNCGRCIDVCSKDVFRFGMRFNNALPASEAAAAPAASSKS